MCLAVNVTTALCALYVLAANRVKLQMLCVNVNNCQTWLYICQMNCILYVEQQQRHQHRWQQCASASQQHHYHISILRFVSSGVVLLDCRLFVNVNVLICTTFDFQFDKWNNSLVGVGWSWADVTGSTGANIGTQAMWHNTHNVYGLLNDLTYFSYIFFVLPLCFSNANVHQC